MRLAAAVVLTIILASYAMAQASRSERARDKWMSCVHSAAERLALTSPEDPEEIAAIALTMCSSAENAAERAIRRRVHNHAAAAEITSSLRQVIGDTAIRLVIEMRE